MDVRVQIESQLQHHKPRRPAIRNPILFLASILLAACGTSDEDMPQTPGNDQTPGGGTVVATAEDLGVSSREKHLDQASSGADKVSAPLRLPTSLANWRFPISDLNFGRAVFSIMQREFCSNYQNKYQKFMGYSFNFQFNNNPWNQNLYKRKPCAERFQRAFIACVSLPRQSSESGEYWRSQVLRSEPELLANVKLLGHCLIRMQGNESRDTASQKFVNHLVKTTLHREATEQLVTLNQGTSHQGQRTSTSFIPLGGGLNQPATPARQSNGWNADGSRTAGPISPQREMGASGASLPVPPLSSFARGNSSAVKPVTTDREPTADQMLQAMRSHPAAAAGRNVNGMVVRGVEKGSCRKTANYQYRCDYKPDLKFDCKNSFDCMMNAIPNGWNTATFTRIGNSWAYSGSE